MTWCLLHKFCIANIYWPSARQKWRSKIKNISTSNNEFLWKPFSVFPSLYWLWISCMNIVHPSSLILSMPPTTFLFQVHVFYLFESHGVCLALPVVAWICDQLQHRKPFWMIHHWENNDSPSPWSNQLLIDFQLVIGFHVPHPSHQGLFFMEISCMPCGCSQNRCNFTYTTPQSCLESNVSLQTSTTSRPYNCVILSFVDVRYQCSI